MQVTTQHAEAVGERPGISVEKRLLLDWIALHATDVTPRDIERPTAVIANLAHSGLAVGNRTAVAAGKAAHPVAIELLIQLVVSLADVLVNDVAQRGHEGYLYFTPLRANQGWICAVGEKRAARSGWSRSQAWMRCWASATCAVDMRGRSTPTRYLLASSPPSFAREDHM